MNPDQFFELFLKELAGAPVLQGYYKFLGKKSSFLFRRNYFIRRLEWIARQAGSPENKIWDFGCGYGTTAIFLTLRGHTVHGSTLEFYLKELEKRVRYWSQFGDLSRLDCAHEDLFDQHVPRAAFDRIIVQDTLHHVEPIDEGLKILTAGLKPGGSIIVVDVNGRSLFIRFPLYLQRGNKRIITLYDEKLQRSFLIGNENVRSYDTWKRIFEANGLKIADHEFIRYFPPFLWSEKNYQERVTKEKELWHTAPLRRNYFFMGMNLVIEPKSTG